MRSLPFLAMCVVVLSGARPVQSMPTVGCPALAVRAEAPPSECVRVTGVRIGELPLEVDVAGRHVRFVEWAQRDAAASDVIGFRVEKRHTNTMRICHGGMMATFCDMLLPITAIRCAEGLGNRFLPTVSLDIDYLAPSPLGAWVQGEAQVLRTTRSLVFAQGLVTADGEPVARVSGVFKIGAAAASATPGAGEAG